MPIEDVYEELYEVLSNMDKATVMKIPEDILNKIITQRNTSFKTSIDEEDLFNEDNISKETMDLLCWIDYNYWASLERKKEVDDIKKIESLSRDENFDAHSIFEKNDMRPSNVESINNPSQELLEKKKNSFISIIKNIINLFKNIRKIIERQLKWINI